MSRNSVKTIRADLAEGADLVRALSHDLGAQLMVLEHSFQQMTHRLHDQAAPDLAAGAQHVQACLNESKRLLRDLSHAARGARLSDPTEPVASGEVVAEVAYEQHPLLAKRGIDLRIDDDLPVVLFNRQRLKQVFTNLVRNAALHGCATIGPAIRIYAPASLSTARLAAMVVHDNGRGIPVEDRERIFEAGRRLDSKAPGSGMGLAVVRRFARQFGGQASVTDALGDGAAFLIQLPRAAEP